MRVFSHTCSNTEIVCALGAAHLIVGIDTDSDFPQEVVGPLPKLGRDLDLDVAGALALKPDLVLTSLTVPGHERIVDEFRAAGVTTLICDPVSLDDIYGDIARIATAIGTPERGEVLIAEMRAAMPPVERQRRPRVLLEWWPKPVIVPARQSWATDLIRLAGGDNPWGTIDAKSRPLTDEDVFANPPDVVAMSWCGVKVGNYRPEVVRRREGWSRLPAVANNCIVGISEEFLGRPGPRVVEGYRQLRAAIARS